MVVDRGFCPMSTMFGECIKRLQISPEGREVERSAVHLKRQRFFLASEAAQSLPYTD
jgi:hypothetical protein